jgi:hypothetical protein
MMRVRPACATPLLILLAGFCLASAALAQTTLPRRAVFDLDGNPVDPFAASPDKVVVLVFLRTDCPVSSRYAPVIQRISAQHERDATFWLVYSDKSESAPAIRKYLEDYDYHLPALRDPEHLLVKLGQVQITPEVAVFDRGRHLVYDGRIDNQYLDLGRTRPAPTTQELEEALRAALADKPIAKAEVRGVGCYISDVE